MYTKGVGLEDFEECEHTFTPLNNLASVTRHSTPFHRQQQIDEHFDFMISTSTQPRGISFSRTTAKPRKKIAMNSASLQVLEERLHTAVADYETYLQQERDHQEVLRREPPDVAWIVEYMELLEKRDTAEKLSITATQDHRNLDFHIINSGWTAPKIKDVRTRYRTMYSRSLMLEELAHFEELNSIEQ
ncbi:hypothetical protein B0H14DRAFT_3531972 [Mycena olivaceomarginata]|nr:hypothetical protein B0H14DRAFT_3531972 [Mycena olivaceomarginata]